MRNLAYTVAFDPPGCSGHRSLAKMLASSLLRTYFTGDVMVFRNTPNPLFSVERKGLKEVFIETPETWGQAGAELSWCWKYRVRDWIDPSRYGKILFLDCDSLALRNIDHLLAGDWDIAYQPERGLNITFPQFACFLRDEELEPLREAKVDGVNSGTIAVAANRYREVMEEWERIDSGQVTQRRTCLDQGSWNRLLLDTKLRKSAFPKGEVTFPLYLEPKYHDYKKSSLVHCLGANVVEKVQFTYGLYMSTFFCDPTGFALNLLEM